MFLKILTPLLRVFLTQKILFKLLLLELLFITSFFCLFSFNFQVFFHVFLQYIFLVLFLSLLTSLWIHPIYSNSFRLTQLLETHLDSLYSFRLIWTHSSTNFYKGKSQQYFCALISSKYTKSFGPVVKHARTRRRTRNQYKMQKREKRFSRLKILKIDRCPKTPQL